MLCTLRECSGEGRAQPRRGRPRIAWPARRESVSDPRLTLDRGCGPRGDRDDARRIVGRAGQDRGAERIQIRLTCQIASRAARDVGRRRASSRTASAARRWSSAICPRRCFTFAARNASAGPASTAARSARAASRAPPSRLRQAAASSRSARRAGSGVRRAARSSRAAAASRPPRDCARAADSSSSAAISSSGNSVACARCHARRSGSTSASVTSASARCTSCRSSSGRRAVGSRAHQGMPEPDPRTELDQSRRLGRVRGIRAEPQHSGRPPQQRRVAERFGRRGHEQTPGVLRERRQPTEKALLDATGQRDQIRLLEPVGELCRRPGARQLEQRKRVAAGLGDDPVADAGIHRAP